MRSAPTCLVLAWTFLLPTPAPARQSPTLGGPIEAFLAKYGEPIRSAFGRTAIARWGITVDAGRITGITRNACPGETLAPNVAAAEAAVFIPADASTARSFKTDDGWQAQRRTSATLAKRLPAGAFKGCKGSEPPGTFSYSLSPERGSWWLILGTCL
jgi:hypothetical protein